MFLVCDCRLTSALKTQAKNMIFVISFNAYYSVKTASGTMLEYTTNLAKETKDIVSYDVVL